MIRPDAPPLAEPALPAADAPRPVAADVTLRRVETLAEYQECVAIQEETWGRGFRELVPTVMLMVSQKLGGVCAGAFTPGGRLLGFVFGLTGPRDGRLVHWSDLLAVRPEARGAQLGERLKRYQRELVLGVGAATMYWTFDPLVARNAHLNLVRLGARAAEYVPNMYGDNTGSPLHGALDTDRLIAEWDLTRSPGTPSGDGRAGPAPVRVPVPRDLEALSHVERVEWRMRTRRAFQAHLARGYEVVGFQRGDDHELPYYELAPRGEA